MANFRTPDSAYFRIKKMASITLDTMRITGSLDIHDTGVASQQRASILKQTPDAVLSIDMANLRVWDAYQTNLPGTAAADDLALVGGTFGTAPPKVEAGDLKAAGATVRYLRFAYVLPESYDAGETAGLRMSAGVVTTVADTSCTVDVQAYRLDKLGGISADLCTTAAQTINATTLSDKLFAFNPATLVAGDVLDVRVAIACNDAATATAVTPTIASFDRICDIIG